MALSNCLECGKKVSTSAKICPSCGFKNPTKVPDSWTKIFTKSALVIIGIPTLIMFLATWKPYGETGFKDKTINQRISIERWQDPTCGNKTLPEIIKGTFFNTKWSAYQNKNDMNGKYAQLTGVNKNDKEISLVFKFNYNRWDVMQKNNYLDNLDFSFAWNENCK